MDEPSAGSAATGGQPARRTRRPDAWTTLFLGLTGVLGAWSLTLVALTVVRLVAPAADADDDTFDLKAIGAATVAVIAVAQGFTMGAAMGKLPRAGLGMASLMRAHRRAGRVGLTLAAAVALLCWRSTGGPPTVDGLAHGAIATVGLLAIAAKLALLRWRPRLAFVLAPWLGLVAAASFVAVAAIAGLGDDLFELEDDD